MTSLRFVLCFALLTALTACRRSPSRSADPEQAAVQTAVAAVDEFHKNLSSGKTGEICKAAAPTAFTGATGLSCPEYLTSLAAKLGGFVEARRPQLPIAATNPTRVGMEYLSRYRKGEAREHFEFVMHGSQATLTSYRVVSDALQR